MIWIHSPPELVGKIRRDRLIGTGYDQPPAGTQNPFRLCQKCVLAGLLHMLNRFKGDNQIYAPTVQRDLGHVSLQKAEIRPPIPPFRIRDSIAADIHAVHMPGKAAQIRRPIPRAAGYIQNSSPRLHQLGRHHVPLPMLPLDQLPGSFLTLNKPFACKFHNPYCPRRSMSSYTARCRLT